MAARSTTLASWGILDLTISTLPASTSLTEYSLPESTFEEVDLVDFPVIHQDYPYLLMVRIYDRGLDAAVIPVTVGQSRA